MSCPQLVKHTLNTNNGVQFKITRIMTQSSNSLENLIIIFCIFEKFKVKIFHVPVTLNSQMIQYLFDRKLK